MMKKIQVAELLGDGIATELSESMHAVADALPIDFIFHPVDLSLAMREHSKRDVIKEAHAAMREYKLAIKYPTVTRTISPNAILRRLCDFSVILRPVISIPGISSNFKERVFLQIVRIATGGTYDDPGRLIGKDSAISIRIVEGGPCRQAAKFAFNLARKKGLHLTSSSKHTIQKVTDGLFESIVKEVHQDFPDVAHDVELFDALLAKIILHPQDYQVVLVLNEYGDFLSDMASGLVGSIGTGASGTFSFDDNDEVRIAMFDPSGGTAPDIAGQNKCNPTSILFSLGMLLDHIDQYEIGHGLRMSILSLIEEGACTVDLGGKLGTREFTREVINHLPDYLDRSKPHAAAVPDVDANN